MTEIVPTLINGRWTLSLPEHRAHRAEWVTGWERERLGSMHDVLEPGMTIIDVGAEEGDLPALWASWGCKVAMIEPVPATWANIRFVWEANDLPMPVGMFVGFASDVDDLAPAGGEYGATGHVLDGFWPACSSGPVMTEGMFAHLSEQSGSIPQVTLNTFAARHSLHVDALTIDVEGSELRVLRGADHVLLLDRPHVWVSIHADRDWMDAQYGGTQRADVDWFMAAYGYTPHLLAVDHEIHVYYEPPE